ncbi:MAG: hypothetical protein M3N53_09640 [Actinomycetota bacterium]|nr:hypothetical protein [Actinomycetota bacterium]
MSQLGLEDLEARIKELPGVLGCVILRSSDGSPSEIQAFTQIGTDRDVIQSRILDQMASLDLGSPVSQVFVFELEAESYFGDLESLERAAEFAEQEAVSKGPLSAGGADQDQGATAVPSLVPDVRQPRTDQAPRPALRRVALTSSSWTSQAEVALGGPGNEVVGKSSSEKTPHGLKVLAEATLEAVRSLVTEVEFKLQTAALVTVGGQEAVLVVVQEESKFEVLGAALTRGGPVTETCVRATLDAVNRRLANVAT